MAQYLNISIFKHFNIAALRSRKGVSTLPTMLLLGSIIIEIVIAMAFLTYYFNTLNFSARLTSESLETARAGAQDGINKVILDKNAYFLPAYQVTTSNGRTANVTITRPIACSPDPASPVTGQTLIDSVATVFNKNRAIRAVMQIDCLSGQVGITSLGEL